MKTKMVICKIKREYVKKPNSNAIYKVSMRLSYLKEESPKKFVEYNYVKLKTEYKLH